MEGLDLLNVEQQWKPFSYFGLHDPFFAIDADIVINTWIVLAFIGLLVIVVNLLLNHHTLIRHLATAFVSAFLDMTNQAMGHYSFAHFSFITSVFIFLIIA